MDIAIGNNPFSFLEKLFGYIDRITVPKVVEHFPNHYHIISHSVVDGRTAYLIYDFDKKCKYAVHPK